MKHLFLALISILACTLASDETENNKKRPSGSKDIEKECVREFFAKHATCSVVTQPDDEEVHRGNGVFYMPCVNITAWDAVATMGNVEGTTREFFINEESGNLLYSVKLENMKYYSPAISIHFYQMDEEPVVITDEIYEKYPHTVLTAKIPLENGKVTQWSMEKAIVSTFFLSEGTYKMELGPNFTESENPQVHKVLHAFGDKEHLALKEGAVTAGPLYFRAHVQKHICDFGLPIANRM